MAFDTKVFATRDYAAKELTDDELTLDNWGICYYVDGQGSAADDLATITGGIEGQVVIIKANGVTLTIKHETGNISLSSGVDFALTAEKQIVLVYDGTYWRDLVGSQADAYVTKALFDAHTILAATADNTPAALEVTEQTVVGRITGGNIAALSVAQLITLALSATLPENVSVDLEDVLTADGKYTGITMAGVAGATLAFGDLVYLQTADHRWELASADDAAAGHNLLLGICVLAAAGDGSATKVLLFGTVRADTAFPDLTLGAPVFMSTTAGDIQVAAPSGATDIIRIVGHGGYTLNELIFNPSPDWFELA